MPRAFDAQQLTVDRDPLRQLDMSIGKLPTLTLDPAAILAGFVDSIKQATGIDLGSVPLLIESIGGVLQQVIEWLEERLNVEQFLDALGDVGDFFVDLLDRAGFLAVLDDVITFFTDLADRAGFLGILEDVVDFFGSILDFSTWSAGLKQFVDFFVGLLNPSGWLDILDDVVSFFATILNFPAWSAALKTFVDFFVGLLNPSGWLTIVNDVANFVSTIVNWPAWSGLLKQVIDFFGTVGNFGNWSAIFKQVIDFFAGLLNLPAWLGVFENVIDFFGGILNFSTWSSVLKQVIDFFAGLLNLPAWLGVFENVIDFFGGILNFSTWSSVLKQVIDWFVGLADGLVDGVLGIGEWLGGLTIFGQSLIDGLWSAVSGGAAAIGKTIEDALTAVGDWAVSLTRDLTGFDFGDIGTWARNLLSKGLGWQGLFDLFGSIPATILGVLPIPAINLTNPELMARGGFDTEATLTPGSGWSWDGTQRYPVTATTGGSAKVLGAATTRALYANQSIEVAAGDKLIVGCYVKSTGTVGTGGIRIDVVEFNGTTQGATVPIAQRNGSANWVYLGNTAETAYTVGANVTSIRVKLSITVAAANGSTVWFDAISVKKTGLLDGNWMEGILQGAGTVVGDLQGIVDGIKSAIEEVVTSGNPLSAIKTSIERIFGGLFGLAFMPANTALDTILETAIPGLNGNKIVDGEVSVDFLPVQDLSDELGTTITTGSGAKMSRRNTSSEKDALAGYRLFEANFFDTVDQISADITASTSTGRFTVTYAGYYIVELGFTTNSSPPGAAAFNVAPMVVLNGANINGVPTPYKIGGDALGSYNVTTFGTFGNWSRAAHDTFIVYLNAGDYVQAGYRNFLIASDTFFVGDSYGASTYFSISMLNRTAEG